MTLRPSFMLSCPLTLMAINQNTLNRLQIVQNAAARLITRAKTPVLMPLHWPVIIDFKISLMTLKAF